MERRNVKAVMPPRRAPSHKRYPQPETLEQRPVGRGKTLYRDGYAELAFKVCLLGATDVELADIFDVSLAAIRDWKVVYPEFGDAVARGKEQADARVAHALYCRAIGYSYEAEKVAIDAKSGAVAIGKYIEHLPPDVQAAIYWLNNRRPDRWKPKPVEDTLHGVAPPTIVINPVQVNVAVATAERKP